MREPAVLPIMAMSIGNGITLTIQVPRRSRLPRSAATLQNCNLYNGWCNTSASLALSAVEPVSGYSITLIEGSNSGQPISCSAGANCNVTLKQGSNSLTYWAHSTFGDTTAAGSLTTKVDSVAPAISNTITGTPWKQWMVCLPGIHLCQCRRYHLRFGKRTDLRKRRSLAIEHIPGRWNIYTQLQGH